MALFSSYMLLEVPDNVFVYHICTFLCADIITDAVRLTSRYFRNLIRYEEYNNHLYAALFWTHTYVSTYFNQISRVINFYRDGVKRMTLIDSGSKILSFSSYDNQERLHGQYIENIGINKMRIRTFNKDVLETCIYTFTDIEDSLNEELDDFMYPKWNGDVVYDLYSRVMAACYI